MSTQTVSTIRFGVIEYTAEDVIRLVGGILGFPSYEQYLILQHKEGSPFRWLQSLDEPSLAFLVVDPSHFLSDYAPEMELRHALDLQLTEETARLVYTIVTIPRGKPEEMTLNLAGPIVINAECGIAKQVVLDDPAYSIKFEVNRAPQPTEAAA